MKIVKAVSIDQGDGFDTLFLFRGKNGGYWLAWGWDVHITEKVYIGRSLDAMRERIYTKSDLRKEEQCEIKKNSKKKPSFRSTLRLQPTS